MNMEQKRKKLSGSETESFLCIQKKVRLYTGQILVFI